MRKERMKKRINNHSLAILWKTFFPLFLLTACQINEDSISDKSSSFSEDSLSRVERPVASHPKKSRETQSTERLGEGVIEANRKVSVYSPLAMLVKQSNAREGKLVKKGDLLFQLDTEEYENRIRQLKASLQEKELAFWEILIGQGYAWKDTANIPPQKMELARIKSGYASTWVEYEIAVRQLQKTRIEAPASGFISELKLFPNDYAKTTEPCCIIVNTDRLKVVFYILEQDRKVLKKGDSVLVTPLTDIGKGKSYKAIITNILPYVDEQGMIKVKAFLEDPEDLLPGINVVVHRPSR